MKFKRFKKANLIYLISMGIVFLYIMIIVLLIIYCLISKKVHDDFKALEDLFVNVHFPALEQKSDNDNGFNMTLPDESQEHSSLEDGPSEKTTTHSDSHAYPVIDNIDARVSEKPFNEKLPTEVSKETSGSTKKVPTKEEILKKAAKDQKHFKKMFDRSIDPRLESPNHVKADGKFIHVSSQNKGALAVNKIVNMVKQTNPNLVNAEAKPIRVHNTNFPTNDD